MATATPASTGADSRARRDASVVLADGETVLVRALRPADAPALAAFHLRQSPESNYRRFFSAKPVLTPTELRHFTDVDMVGRAALCVERHGEFIAWASYERWPGRDDADTAFMVDEAHQGKGIATLLLEHLAAIATSNGIERFTAEVLAENRAMLSVFARAGWPLQRTYESGVIEVDFPIASTHEYLDSLAEREHRADSRAMARLLLPRSIAVVGASDRPNTVGSVLWRNITRTANVPVHAVNPNRTTIRRVDRDGVARSDPAWPTVAAVPDDVWLAVVAVPAAALDTTLDDCIAAHVRGAVIVTAVDGDESPTVDVDRLVARARRNGVRIIGPSSMGVVTSHHEIGLDAALVPVELSPGSIAIVMQSGSLGASLLGLAQRLEMGLSWFVSLGDRSDVSGNDLLQFWDDDDSTNVIAMYNETLGNSHRFARIARRVSLRRPIVAVRAGRGGDRALRRRAVPALRTHRGAERDGDAGHRPGAGHTTAAPRPTGGGRVQFAQPGQARRGGARRRRVGGRAGTDRPRLDRRVRGLPHGDRRRGRVGRCRRRPRHPRPADPRRRGCAGAGDRRSVRPASNRWLPWYWERSTGRSGAARGCRHSRSPSPRRPCSGAPTRTPGGSTARLRPRRLPTTTSTSTA